MISFGSRNPFPFTLGGGESIHKIEQDALLDAFEPALDREEGTENWCETYAEARAVSMVWAINKRLSNQFIAKRMMENLPVYEESCRLHPYPNEPLVIRRSRLDAKLRGATGNSDNDLEAIADSLGGANFIEMRTVHEDDELTYWPGMNPGPPGYEWCSNRAHIAVVVSGAGIPESSFDDLRYQIGGQFDEIGAAWLTFFVGVDGPFICGVGVLGRTML